MQETLVGMPEESRDETPRTGALPRVADEQEESVQPPLRDGYEALRVDPCTRLAIPRNRPGPAEIIQGKEAPRCAAVDAPDGIPTLELAYANMRWLLLMLGVYERFLQRKAPPLHNNLDSIVHLREILHDLRSTLEDEDEKDVVLTFSRLDMYVLREALICCRWLINDWLPACEERHNLLVPLDLLLQDVNRVFRILE